MANLTLLRNANAGPERVVFSRKARLWLVAIFGEDAVGYMQTMGAYREAYLNARNYDGINRISTFEMERIVKNGLNIATRGKARL